MIADGRSFGTFDANSWMNGLIVFREAGWSIEATPSLRDRSGISALLQTGPWLVRNGIPATGLDPQRRAARTVMGRDDHGRWALGVVGACSLDELTELLRARSVVNEFDFQQALNLDGGPSSGLWVKSAPRDFYLREGWPVRNYLGVVRRE
jgi:hypothetical protein